jgi:hypothetical protein
MRNRQLNAAQIVSMISSGTAAASGDGMIGAAADMAIALLHCIPPMVELSEQVIVLFQVLSFINFAVRGISVLPLR